MFIEYKHTTQQCVDTFVQDFDLMLNNKKMSGFTNLFSPNN